MNEHQKRLWQNMINLIQGYLDGKTEDFYKIVGELEGNLDASEIKDTTLISQWYGFWMPLEVRRAIEGNPINKKQAIAELIAMKEFLLSNNDDS
ncbi:MAG: hypothetical protein CK425_09280 [Parachlamydia sp.]|nr:MAG: hypothetical protein CK425_09280 [Parachlamydia sp.]